MPSYIDDAGNPVTVTINYGNTSSFVYYSSSSFAIIPSAATSTGTYPVIVTLTDSANPTLTTSASFNVIVTTATQIS